MASKRSIHSPHVGEPPPETWSNCLVVGNQVYVAGMTAAAEGANLGEMSMYQQARATFTKIQHLIEAAGGRMNDIVKLNIFVIDIKRREEVWKARREFFTGDFPVSTLVQVTFVGGSPETLVEIEAQALLGAGQP